MTQQQIESLSEPLVEIVNEIEDGLLKKIAKQLARDGDISDTSKWRIRQLAQMGKLNSDALKLIQSYSGIQSQGIYDALRSAALEEINHTDEAVKDAVKANLLNGGSEAIAADKAAENALKSYYKQAKSDFNMVNTVMAYKAKQTYTNAVNEVYDRMHKELGKGAAEVVLGTDSLQSAIRQTIKSMAQRGIPAFVDKRGHEWTAESYVRMDLRTTMGNTARAAQWSRCDEFGIDLIEVDSHMGARPLCAPYQGRIYARKGKAGKTTDLDGNVIAYGALSETSYGEPAGLFGINCGHNCYPFIPGISTRSYFPYSPKENDEKYRQVQKQRRMERDIRKTKQECMMLNETGDEEGFADASIRLKAKREQYASYCSQAGLTARSDRTQVYGFDKSVSAKAVWAERKNSAKVLDNSGGWWYNKRQHKE